MFSSRRLLAYAFLVQLLTVICIGHAGGRKLFATGDILGVKYDSENRAQTAWGAQEFNKTKELQDHAHFYAVADLLTRWAETAFALSAYAHSKLPQRQNGTATVVPPCVYDGKTCLFNPINVAAPGFPAPLLLAEHVLKRFAVEADSCRGSHDHVTCHMDTNCGWDDLTEACYLMHDPLNDFTTSILQCRDSLYSANNAVCWRLKPELDTFRPCGAGACKLYKAGTETGLPEDRCMPESWSTKLTPLDVYSLLKRFYGSASGDEAVAGSTEEGADAAEPHGFGSCSTAALHHAMKTSCRHPDKEGCLQDSRCGWMTGVVSGEWCVLSKETAVGVLMGSSGFTRTVIQMEKQCGAAESADACAAVPLKFIPDGAQTATGTTSTSQQR